MNEVVTPTQIVIKCLGYNLYADWYEGSKSEVMLVLIGKSSSKARAQERVNYITGKTKMSALVLDYSGHGLSPFVLDDVSPAQHFIEVVDAYDYIKARLPESKVTVFGTSYGGFFGALLTNYRDVEKLVIRVPAIYPPDTFYSKDKNINSDSIRATYRTNPDNFISHPDFKSFTNYKKPVLVVIHGLDDVCPKPVTDAYVKAFSADSFDQHDFMHSESQVNPSKETVYEYLNKIVRWIQDN